MADSLILELQYLFLDFHLQLFLEVEKDKMKRHLVLEFAEKSSQLYCVQQLNTSVMTYCNEKFTVNK